jgi:hypothetical protein
MLASPYLWNTHVGAGHARESSLITGMARSYNKSRE